MYCRAARTFAKGNKIAPAWRPLVPPSAKKIHFSSVSERVPHTHKRSFGQPTPETHPELMVKGEVTPGFVTAEYESRRSKLMQALPEGSVVISPGYTTRYMSNNVFYHFHQNTDFWYLTGFNEPDAAMILEKNTSKRGYKQTMFVPPKSESAELWDGPRTGVEGAKEIFGANEAYDNARFPMFLKDALLAKHVFMDSPVLAPSILSENDAAKRILDFGNFLPLNWIKRKQQKALKPLSVLIQELRVIKSDQEIAIMKESGVISAKSFIEAMKWTKPGYTEAQLWAKLDYECRMRGSSILAYVPVVAGGPNGLSMHYVRNDMMLRDGDLVLVDCGGEYKGYASDITRTWPVNGKFSPAQKKLYQAVLNVNKACIKLCTEQAAISLNGIHTVSTRLMQQELSKIGWDISTYDLERILYPHHVGHYLGLDVHDTHDLDRSRKLKRNMVVTIEPGIYVPYDDSFPKEFQGIAIRIEDNVAVGVEEPHILTSTAPKEIVDIEYCCSH
ncbi:peptidase M24, structural domain-containing protein [Syncephalastrum racemosum]|uniref:Peptidase M24, structural domain-containing protein n=1 Tax=Syncephalastrum racemosum TaxID=13706 RepID=A0A1X2HDX5_SYNRA|nr:peptidase M24, structural domain-containing protein [Syncephalastrum racemosum]